MGLFRFAAVIAVAILVAGAGPADAAKKVKIGFISTLSGPFAVLGRHHKNGFRLGLEHFKQKLGGVDVEVIEADDQAIPDVGVQMARKLLERDKVDVITGVMFSHVMVAVTKPILANKTLLISSFAGPSVFAGKGCNPYLFVASVQNDTSYEAAGKMVNDMGVERAFLMAPNYQAGRDAIVGFKRYYKTGKVVGEIMTKLNQPDYAIEISQVRAAKSDGLFVFMPGGMGIKFVKQYANAGMLNRIPIYSAYTVGYSTLKAQGEAAVGVNGVAFWNDDLDNAANRKFVGAYKKKHGATPSIFAAMGYDVVNFLDVAVRGSGGDMSNHAAVRKALHSSKINSIRGNFKFNTNQFPIQDFIKIQAVKEGGELKLVTRGTVFKNHKDSYYRQCPMK